MGLIIGLRGRLLVQPALFFEPGPFPELPGPAVGPNGPKIGQKPGAGFIMLSSLRSAQGYVNPLRGVIRVGPSSPGSMSAPVRTRGGRRPAPYRFRVPYRPSCA